MINMSLIKNAHFSGELVEACMLLLKQISVYSLRKGRSCAILSPALSKIDIAAGVGVCFQNEPSLKRSGLPT